MPDRPFQDTLRLEDGYLGPCRTGSWRRGRRVVSGAAEGGRGLTGNAGQALRVSLALLRLTDSFTHCRERAEWAALLPPSYR